MSWVSPSVCFLCPLAVMIAMTCLPFVVVTLSRVSAQCILSNFILGILIYAMLTYVSQGVHVTRCNQCKPCMLVIQWILVNLVYPMDAMNLVHRGKLLILMDRGSRIEVSNVTKLSSTMYYDPSDLCTRTMIR